MLVGLPAPAVVDFAARVVTFEVAGVVRDARGTPVTGVSPHETLVASPGDDTDLARFPGGEAIVYASNRHGDYDLFVTDTRGLDEFQLTSDPGDERHPTWSPNGTRIAFERDSLIHVLNVTRSTGNRREVLIGAGTRPTWGLQPVLATSTGPDVAVQTANIELTFAGVNTAGETQIIPLPAIGEMPPGYFRLENTSLAFDVQTTATITPPIRVCVTVSDSIDSETFHSLRLLHGEGGVLVDRTILPLDFASRTICGEVTSLSPFHVAQAIDNARPAITGLILDADGNPVAGAGVHLRDGSAGQIVTDTAGRFTFANLAPGEDFTVQPLADGLVFTPDQLLV